MSLNNESVDYANTPEEQKPGKELGRGVVILAILRYLGKSVIPKSFSLFEMYRSQSKSFPYKKTWFEFEFYNVFNEFFFNLHLLH